MLVNDKRGEIAITLGEREFILRYSMHATRELQQHFKVKSLPGIFTNADNWSSDDYATLIFVGLKHGSAGSSPLTFDEVLDSMTLDQLPYYMNTILAGLKLSGSASAAEPDDARPTQPNP